MKTPTVAHNPSGQSADDVAAATGRDAGVSDDDRDAARLLDWLADHDAPCPLCGYNLHALTRPVCPECQQELVLSVGTRRLRLGWWIVAMVPGFFSGIAAAFLAFPIVMATLTEGGGVPVPILLVDGFGWLSGIAALMLAVRRVWFLRMDMRRQRAAAMGIWAVHVGMFIVLLFLAFLW